VGIPLKRVFVKAKSIIAEAVSTRTFVFYSILSLPIIVWTAIVIPFWAGDTDFPAALVSAIVKAAPLIAGDISVVGEITPGILAGLIIALLPSGQYETTIKAVALAVIIYFLYIYLAIFFADTKEGARLLGLISHDPPTDRKTILSVCSNVRVTAIAVAASIIGLKKAAIA
jgi:hypothetical protein